LLKVYKLLFLGNSAYYNEQETDWLRRPSSYQDNTERRSTPYCLATNMLQGKKNGTRVHGLVILNNLCE